MTTSQFPRWRLVAASLVAACGMHSPKTGEVTGSRYIDAICERGRYALEGSAKRTTGITDDSCGFVLGPGVGRLTISADTAGYASYSVSALLVVGNSAPQWADTWLE